VGICDNCLSVVFNKFCLPTVVEPSNHTAPVAAKSDLPVHAIIASFLAVLSVLAIYAISLSHICKDGAHRMRRRSGNLNFVCFAVACKRESNEDFT